MIEQRILVPARDEARGHDEPSREKRLEAQRRIEQHDRELNLFRWALLFLMALAIGVAMPVLAQEKAAAVTVSENEEYGQYLTDADGRALYLFTADTRGQGEAEAEVACSGECLDRWPPLYTQADPQAQDTADASKLDTIVHKGKQMVTYGGWPLYYFYQDTGPGQTTGQDIRSFGGEWYLVTPEGEKVGHE